MAPSKRMDVSKMLTSIKKIDETDFRTTGKVEIIDQLLLPHQVKYEVVNSAQGAYEAIKSMKIRGAPAIASLAALGIACSLINMQSKPKSIEDLQSKVHEMTAYLLTSRPTAVNLREALDRINKIVDQSKQDSVETLLENVITLCIKVWSEDVERCYAIGDNGAEWLLRDLEASGAIEKGGSVNVLTVCNTGSLATSGYGTALGMIASLWSMGRLEHAYFAQTAPYQQGARLTSLELLQMGIPSTMVPDTAMAALLQGEAGRKVHAFIAGADRIAANGDTANKISTYQISVLCKSIPSSHQPKVVVCAPLTTLDLSMDSGSQIEIEQRPEVEACTVRGVLYDPSSKKSEEEHKEVVSVLFTPKDCRVWNPAFDVTDAKWIDGIVTEIGVAERQGEKDFDLREFVKSKSS